jgi:hypothetical protein
VATETAGGSKKSAQAQPGRFDSPWAVREDGLAVLADNHRTRKHPAVSHPPPRAHVSQSLASEAASRRLKVLLGSCQGSQFLLVCGNQVGQCNNPRIQTQTSRCRAQRDTSCSS